MDKYYVVTWPESQSLMDKIWFDECILINSDQGISKYGNQAYLVPEEYLDQGEYPDPEDYEPKTLEIPLHLIDDSQIKAWVLSRKIEGVDDNTIVKFTTRLKTVDQMLFKRMKELYNLD